MHCENGTFMHIITRARCAFDLLRAEHALMGFKSIENGACNASYARRCSRYEFGRERRILLVLSNSDRWYLVMILRTDDLYIFAKQRSRRR